jgi:hypothetical protein
MAKISNTTTYPTKANPLGTDYVIGTDASSKETKTFTLQSIANLYGGSGSGSVTSVGLEGGTTGLTTISDTTNPITTTGKFTLGGTLATTNGGTGLSALGTRSQVMSVNNAATGLEFTDPKVIETIEANEAISKGDPLYIVSWNNGTSTAVVGKADASNTAKMPCIGLAQENLTTGATGEMMVVGLMDQIDVNAIPSSGANPLVNDVIYVASGGGLTSIKPIDTNLIQNVAIVVNASAQGTLQITAIGRANDLPNIPQGSIWLGDSSGVPSALAIGANTYVLTSNGTTASWQLPGSGSVTGTGTANTLSKWSTGGQGIEDSSIIDTGSIVSIGNPTHLKGDGTTNGNASNLKFYCSNNNHWVEFIGPNHSGSPASYSITLPNKIATQSAVSGGRILEVNSSGVGNWINTPAGSTAGHTIIDMADADTVTSAGDINAAYVMTTTVDSDFTASSIKLQFEQVPTITRIEVAIYTYVEQGINSTTSNVRLGIGTSGGSTTKRKVITLTADDGPGLALTAGTNYVVALRCAGGLNNSGVFAASGKLSNVDYAATIDGNPTLPTELKTGESGNTFTATTLRPALTIY